jgi:cytochrome c-type biogenesis protein CcmH/NrfF
MIKRIDEMKTEIREQMRGGKGNVDIIHILTRKK